MSEPERPTSSARTRASGRVAAGILLSRITGLARVRAIGHFFGVSPVADVWAAATRLPNVLQILLGEGTLSASLIPIYSELLEEGREDEAARFAGAAFGLLATVAIVLALFGVLMAPILVPLIFGGFDPARQSLTVELVRILFPMAAFMVLGAWALGVLNSHRRFFLPYVAPVALNLTIIAAMIVGAVQGAAGERLVRWAAWGGLAGGGLQFVVQLPLVFRLIGEFRPSISLAVVGVREGIRNFVPVVAARGAQNIGSLVDMALASYLAVGAIAALQYAQVLYLLPISLFGLSVAAAELPELSRDRRGSRADIAQNIGPAIERVAYFLIPATFAYMLLGNVISAALFETGEFGESEVLVTWGVLAAYAIGMGASAMSRLLSSAFYAIRDTRTPARIAYLRVLLAAAVGAGLMIPFDRVEIGPLRLGAAGLAMGASLAAWLELALLRRALGRAVGPHGTAPGRIPRIVAAAALGAAAGVAANLLLPDLHPILRAIGTLAPFGIVYLVATIALGVSDPIRGMVSR